MIPNIELCEKILKNLKKLDEEGGIFKCSLEKAEKREKMGDFLLGLPLASKLTAPARTALLVLVEQLNLQPFFNIGDGCGGPFDFRKLMQDAENTIALFK